MGISLDITEPTAIALMLASLFFLVSLLINSLQYHFYKRKTDRFIQKEESLLRTLIRVNKIIKKLENICIYEMEAGTSLKDIGQSLGTTRNMINVSANDIQGNLRSFREYRAREKAIGKHMKKLDPAQNKKTTQSISYLK